MLTLPGKNDFRLGFQIIRITVLLGILSTGLPFFSYGQQETVYTFEPLVVTASRIPSGFYSTNRNVVIIGEEEIENSTVASVADLLESCASIDIRKRGPFGVQSDVSLRRGTFEQTLILIDGTKINNPQTGHHNLNLPLELEDIERIEILKGPASRLYGPNAFSGVINIITKKAETQNLKIKATTGYYGLMEGNISFSQPLGVSLNRISISGRRSDGYRHNTDFSIWNLFLRSHLNTETVDGDISFGYKDKEFGANSFYSELYPNEREHIRMAFIKGGINLNKTEADCYWKRLEDDFSLDPEIQKNHHITNTYGLELKSTVSSPIGSSAMGLEWGKEEMKSSNLDEHSRVKGGFFIEHKLPTIKKTTVIFGSALYYYSSLDWLFYPGFDIGLKLNKNIHLYASAEKSFRAPSYTELYYNTPANEGNPELTPEEALAYETGIRMIRTNFLVNFNAFIRKENNIIDWVRSDSTEPWRASNTGEASTKGLEIDATFKPVMRRYKGFPIPYINLEYTLLGIRKGENLLQSKYLLTHPQHKFTLDVNYELSNSLKQNWEGSYEVRSESKNVFILDTGISWETKYAKLFVEVYNLLNTEYTQAGWIPMPGRWARTGIKLSL